MLETLWVVEDDPDDRYLLSAFINEHYPNKFSLTFFENGKKLVEHIKENGIAARAVLLDINMPEMNGMQVLEWMEKNLEGGASPVVVYTTSSDKKDVKQAYELGANGYVVKPGAFSSQDSKLNDVVKFWMMSNEPRPLGDTHE